MQPGMHSLLVVVATLLTSINAQFQLFVNGTQSTENLSHGCINALNATITCDPYIQQLVATDYYGSLGNASLHDSVCEASCGTSLASYHAHVVTACSSDPQPWQGIPAVWAGDTIWAMYNQTCLKDPATGHYCADEIAAINLGNLDLSIISLSPAQLCSPCMITLLKTMQKTPYSNYDVQYVQDWKTIQSRCNTGPLPTAPQPPATNMTDLPDVTTSDPANLTCITGNHYTVKPGDNVQKIATAHGVATGTLMIINGIFPDGTNLLAGQVLCLPRTCPTYLVKPGDNCAAIAALHGISFAQLGGYNPSINMYCTNLIADTNICVGPSESEFTPSTIPGATATSTNYARATVTPPGPVPFGTTPKCGKYYQVNPGDFCQQISMNNSITVQEFMDINPSINPECTNLTPGFYYCVWPTADWNATDPIATSTIVTPPAPTPTGTTPNCFQWHTVVAGDTCSFIGTLYGITFAQFRLWNPQINDQCTNLLLGDAYCVNAPAATGPITASSSPTPTGSVVPGRHG